MKIVLLGAPGSGKGTRAEIISKLYGIPHISTGDLFRDNMKEGTPLGLKVKSIMDAGGLCPDDITIEMVKERLEKEDCKKGYLLDGFPRNMFQAESLEKISAPDKVININIDIALLENRILGRRICDSCHKPFHVDNIGVISVCPDCGGKLLKRKDDTPEIVRQRIDVYFEKTHPLIDYYRKLGRLVDMDGNIDVNDLSDYIKKALQ